MDKKKARAAFLQFLVLVIAVTGLAVSRPTAAGADSGWKCGNGDNHLMLGSICLRTIRKDGSHISGADVAYSHSVFSAGGCVWIRFGHGIQLGNGEANNGFWLDNGAVRSCPGEDHSFFWSHGGAGAWLGDGWNVYGYILVWRNPPNGNSRDAVSSSPYVWWPNH